MANAISTLAQIRKKIRRLTASPDPTQLTDSDINEYIDCMYEQDLPAHLKLWKLRDKYTFYTEPGEDRYAFDTTLYNTFQPPAYVDGSEVRYLQSQEELFRLFPKQNYEARPTSGDGTASYSFTLTQVPLIKRHVTLTAVDSAGEQQVAQDDPDNPNYTATQQFSDPNNLDVDGNATMLTGTIDYTTGEITITFPAVIPAGTQIYARVLPYTGSRPTSMCLFQDYFIMRPVPDKAYRVDINTYRRPSDLLSVDGDNPEISQWWQFIALGAAIKVLQDRQDIDSIENIAPFFEEQRQLVLQRTVKQQTPQRVATIYEGYGSGYANNLGYWG